ncbi:MAG: hypothetical protein II717_04175 [Lachnospiraceae bacterium]|nr:hypothetical protein [Lachnospiraceae bacterium]
MDNYDENNQLVKSGPGALRIVGFILAFILAPVGLILSIVGVVKKDGSKGLSIAGIIISIINIIGSVLITILLLAGILAPQLIKYNNKSNAVSDMQFADTIRSSLITAAMDPEVIQKDVIPETSEYTNIEDIPAGAFRDAVEECIGFRLEDLDQQVKSGQGKVEILYKLEGNQVSVMITNTDFTGSNNYKEENFIVVD